MTLPTHLAAGQIVAKLCHEYPAALLGALIIDLDHLIPYAKEKVLWRPQKFWKN